MYHLHFSNCHTDLQCHNLEFQNFDCRLKFSVLNNMPEYMGHLKSSSIFYRIID